MTYARAVGGLAPDARLDPDGFRRALALRAELEGFDASEAPREDRYYDSRYYQRALAAGDGR
jgi:hypothetical protein